MKNNYKNSIRLILCGFMLFGSAAANSQISNDNIAFRSKTHQFFYNYDTEVGLDEAVYRFSINISDFDTWTTVNNLEDFEDGVHYKTNTNPDSWHLGGTDISFDATESINLMAWEEDNVDHGEYNPEVDDYLYEASAFFTGGESETSITNGGINKPSRWVIAHNADNVDWIFPWVSNWNIQLATAWRYMSGDDCTDPLLFGTLSPNTTVSHFNSNSTAILETTGGWGAPLAYTNYEGESSSDVYYSFTITEPLEVTISTSNDGTDFDTYVKLWNDEGCLDIANLIDSNDDDPDGGSASKLTVDLEAGTYIVMVEGYSSNEGDFELTVETGASTASISDEALSQQFSIYPNPATDNLTIAVGSEIAGSNLSLMNSLGQVVYSSNGLNEGILMVDVSTFESGLYYAVLTYNGQKSVEKIAIR